jgi:hypothetical protein
MVYPLDRARNCLFRTCCSGADSTMPRRRPARSAGGMSGPHAERYGLCDVQADAEDHPCSMATASWRATDEAWVGQGIRATAP